MKPINEVFNGKSYVGLAMDLQSFDRNSHFTDTTVPEWFEKDKVTQPGMSLKPFFSFSMIM